MLAQVDVQREMTETMEDHLSSIDLDRLEDVLVMTENDVGASIDGRPGYN